MKKILSLLLLTVTSISFGYSEYAVLMNDDFGWSSSVLMYTRESKYGSYWYYVVEYGVGCGLWLWRYVDKKVVVNTGSYWTYLDGIGDTLVLPKINTYWTTYTCKIWDVKSLEDAFEDDDLDEDDIEWLSDNWFFEE